MSGGAGGGGGGGAVVRQGHLRKLKTMKKKLFVLRAESPEGGARLEYYESEKKLKAGAPPRRVLPLKGCYNIMRRLDLKQKHVIALFTREEQFCIVAENEPDLHGWLSAILKLHRTDEVSEELLHPIQQVWQVNVQKKGLGATKNIHGLYNLCLTDNTLSLVKIKSQNNVISEIGIPEKVEYTLKNIRRCGDSECFFYMEVGRQTVTGAGELWMHTDDSNIAQSMHSTILHAMRHCAKESENERDHIVIPKGAEGTLTTRRSTYSDGQGRAGLATETGLCVGSCIRQCVCAGEDSQATLAPLAADAEYQHNTLTDKPKHCRTGSLPAGCTTFQEPLKISHKRTWSEPLTGDEVEKHSSCKPVNGTEPAKKSQCARRASTGMRFKLSPAHSKNIVPRSRCDSMPTNSRTVSHSTHFEVERPPPRHDDIEGMDVSRDETDAMAEWYRTPRIPEEPDVCDISRDLFNMSMVPGSSIQHSRTSSMGVEECDMYLGMEPAHPQHPPGGAHPPPPPPPPPPGYLAMTPHEPSGLLSASSGSVCSGTPSTDPRFSEYQLEPATSHITMESRPPRAYSVGSRPAPAPRCGERHRAYSVGASARARPPHHPRASAEDLMLLDFTSHPAHNKSVISRTPPTSSYMERSRTVDEYVDMSPRNAGYVEMRPGEPPAHPAHPAHPSPDGYVEMTYGARPATRPIAIATSRPPPPVASSPDEVRRRTRTPLGSQTIFPFSLESPSSPAGSPAPAPSPAAHPPPPHAHAHAHDDELHPPPQHPLSTLREISEEQPLPAKRSPEAKGDVSCSPQYVQLVRLPSTPEPKDEVAGNPTAIKTIARVEPDNRAEGRSGSAAPVVVARAGGSPPARFSVGEAAAPGLHYAALDLEAARRAQDALNPPHPPHPPRTYTEIDFLRSEKLAADGT